jgi:hypothetical protein
VQRLDDFANVALLKAYGNERHFAKLLRLTIVSY